LAATRRASRPNSLPEQSAPLGEGEGVHEGTGNAGVASASADGDRRRPRGTARDRALRLLTVRARSRLELEDRLVRAGFDPSEVVETLDSLEAVGLIDDRRLAQAVVEHAVTVRLDGRRSVLGTLRSRRLAPDLGEELIGGASAAEDEELRAHELAARRASRLHGLTPEVAFRRLVSFLARRGYPPGLCREAATRALAPDPPDPPDGV
jgi:regulatory protein